MPLDYSDLVFEFWTDLGSDVWGETMHWWFVVADEIYFNRPAMHVPDEWRFRPSPLGPSNEPGDLAADVVHDAGDEALARFGAFVHRYAQRLKAAGADY